MTNEQIELVQKTLIFLSVEDLKKYTPFGENKIRELTKQNDFPMIEIGKTHYVLLSALENYFQNRVPPIVKKEA